MKKIIELLDKIDNFTVGRLKTEKLHMTCGELFEITEKIRNIIEHNEDIELPIWHEESDKPEIDHLVRVKSKEGYEESDYIWDGEDWLQVEYGQGDYITYKTDFLVYVWTYQN